ncbi:MAG TPA: hypothetical protein VL485_05455 [Ktedonobacteraceae bacterium]|nr:hypothetical protein [Ktedonobacteraceae bacterium]
MISALILILVIPLYQALVLSPQGYGTSLNSSEHTATYLAWVGTHLPAFLLYRVLLIAAFALILNLPFSLYRIIVAQEIMVQQERENEEIADEEEVADEGEEEIEEEEEEETSDGLPAHAWRGKGFAVLAVWAGMAGIGLYVLSSIASTIYLLIVSQGYQVAQSLPGGFNSLTGFFSVTTNTVSIGLLALATLLFGAMIARGGRNFWPGIWVAFGYVAIAVTALLSGSAVSVASAPGGGQAPLSSPAIFLLAIWSAWLGIMLLRLAPEA